jgi:predicted phosphodiesterase
MRIIILSDTHGYHDSLKIPDGDMIIHSGDNSVYGEIWEIKKFLKWFGELPHKYKIFVNGNHEKVVSKMGLMKSLVAEFKEYYNFHYLEHESIEIEGLKIFGSPYTPEFFDWAYMYDRPKGGLVWSEIPMDSDIIVTHGPPYGIMDGVVPFDRYNFDHAGCHYLKAKIDLIKPKLNCFGHIHKHYGFKKLDDVLYVNAANCNDAYVPVNKPIVVDTDSWEVVDSGKVDNKKDYSHETRLINIEFD